jgi:phosphatidate cytidylyltransferase
VGELNKRVVSAVIFGPIVILLLIFLPPKFLFVFMGCVLILAVYEFASMVGIGNRVAITVLAAVAFLPLYRGLTGAYILWLLISPAVYLLFRMLHPGRADTALNRDIGRSTVVLLLAEVFLALPLFFLYRLKELGPYLPLILLLIIWASDTAAYALGKTMGRHRLAPAISPKKTYEGLAGAMAGAVLVTVLFRHALEMSLVTSIVVGAFVGILGQLGDMLESIAKRVCEVKDSSGLIPGHGGLLDRIDSFLLTAPFLYHCLAGFGT